jgi:hypothetical protein
VIAWPAIKELLLTFVRRLQRKVFSRWVNQKLVLSRGIKIDDIVDAAADRTLSF